MSVHKTLLHATATLWTTGVSAEMFSFTRHMIDPEENEESDNKNK